MGDATAAAVVTVSIDAVQDLFDSWKDAVVVKLVEIFKKEEAETLSRVLWYLSEEESRFKENRNKNKHTDDSEIPIQPQIPSGLKALKATLDFEDLFIIYAKQLAEETKESDRNSAFLQDMKFVRDKLAAEYPPDELVGVEDFETESEASGEKEKFVLVHVPTFQPTEEPQKGTPPQNGSSGGGVVSHVFWYMIETATKHAVIRAIPPIFINRQLYFALDELIGIIDRTGPHVVMVGLAGVFLSFEAIKHLYQWWGGQITGKRCAKNFVDATFMVGGGVLGGMGGAALGCAIGGPFGTVAGGIIGGIASSAVLHALCDQLTQTLFDVPQDAAVENALNFLGVPMSATNAEINAAFRKLCLKHHPDKGGTSEDFILLQTNMAVIKLSRKELL